MAGVEAATEAAAVSSGSACSVAVPLTRLLLLSQGMVAGTVGPKVNGKAAAGRGNGRAAGAMAATRMALRDGTMVSH